MNKRIISILLVFALVLSASGTTFANVGSLKDEGVVTNYRVIKDNKTERVAEEIKGNLKYVHSMDKINNILTTKVYNLQSNAIVKEEVHNLKKLIQKTKPSSAIETERTSLFFSHYQNTFSNYEYRQTGGSNSGDKFYRLRNKDTYVTQSLSDNKDGILYYINAVDTLNAAEWVIVTSGGSTAIWAVITYFSSGLTSAQVATATGVLLADVIAYNLAVNNCKAVWNTHITYTK